VESPYIFLKKNSIKAICVVWVYFSFWARALGEGEVTDRPIGNQLKLSHERGWGIWQLSEVDLLAQSLSGSSGLEWQSLQIELFGWLQVSFQLSHNGSIT